MNIGVIINLFGPNQQTLEIIDSVNNDKLHKDLDVAVFFEEKHHGASNLNCAISYINTLWGYPGNVIATTLNSAAKLLSIPIGGQRYYYIYNFEWLNHRPFRYEPLMSVICDPKIELICRTPEHAKIIENNFNRKVKFNLETINFNKLMENML